MDQTARDLADRARNLADRVDQLVSDDQKNRLQASYEVQLGQLPLLDCGRQNCRLTHPVDYGRWCRVCLLALLYHVRADFPPRHFDRRSADILT